MAMKLYTRKGDKGQTSLFGGRRVPKNHFRINAFGTLEELTSYFGIVLSQLKDERMSLFIHQVQRDLILIASYLTGKESDFSVLPTHITEMEQMIDTLAEKMPPIDKFRLPEGTEKASSFYLARAVTRRAERELVALSLEEPIDESILVYLNRLSDLFFVMAKFLNFKAGILETPVSASIDSPKAPSLQK